MRGGHLFRFLLAVFLRTFSSFALSSSSSGGSSSMNHRGDAQAFHQYASAAVELSQGSVDASGCLRVIRSVRDIDNDKKRRFEYSGLLMEKENDAQLMMLGPPVECHDAFRWKSTSPNGSKTAILLQDQEKEDQCILEIWNGSCLQHRIRLPNRQHGKVVVDPGGFGSPSWNQQETCLVYSAERKPPETLSFFDDTTDKESASADQPRKHVGGQNVLGLGKYENWGEKYSQQSPLLDLYCVHIETGNVRRVCNVPGGDNTDTTLEGFSLGQPRFTPDGTSVVYTGWDAGGGSQMPRRLGLIYCQQRPSQIYQSSVKSLIRSLASIATTETSSATDTDEEYQILTLSLQLARSPRFSSLTENGSSTLVFLGSKDGFETHSGCLELYAMEWTEKGFCVAPRLVVDQVWDPRDATSSAGHVGGMSFPGLFLLELPDECFISQNTLLLTSQWGSTSQVLKISIDHSSVDDGSAVELVSIGEHEEVPCSNTLVCITRCGGAIVGKQSSTRPMSLYYIKNDSIKEILSFSPMAATSLSNVEPKDVTAGIHLLLDHLEPPKVDGVHCDLPVQSILLRPMQSIRDDGSAKKPPMIVVPHGGPHAVSSSVFLPGYAYLCGHGGYAILLVNYRGSTGFGQGAIESLPGNIGSLDVSDMVAATKKFQMSGLVDPDRIGICGGSHGGFLTAHCTSQFPELFKVAVLRNPVVNIPSMTTATDIPDWCFVEVRRSYHWKEYRPPTEEELIIMRRKSPICQVANVKAPTLVAIGLKDLRVPPSQGLEWYHTLRSMRIPTKLLVYENDDHALATAKAEADHWVNIKQWFDKHL